jgi:hypothetical protein
MNGPVNQVHAYICTVLLHLIIRLLQTQFAQIDLPPFLPPSLPPLLLNSFVCVDVMCVVLCCRCSLRWMATLLQCHLREIYWLW